jgi:hypothetical protein
MDINLESQNLSRIHHLHQAYFSSYHTQKKRMLSHQHQLVQHRLQPLLHGRYHCRASKNELVLAPQPAIKAETLWQLGGGPSAQNIPSAEEVLRKYCKAAEVCNVSESIFAGVG